MAMTKSRLQWIRPILTSALFFNANEPPWSERMKLQAYTWVMDRVRLIRSPKSSTQEGQDGPGVDKQASGVVTCQNKQVSWKIIHYYVLSCTIYIHTSAWTMDIKKDDFARQPVLWKFRAQSNFTLRCSLLVVESFQIAVLKSDTSWKTSQYSLWSARSFYEHFYRQLKLTFEDLTQWCILTVITWDWPLIGPAVYFKGV